MEDSLENKFRLATIAPLDRRMKRKHLAVYGFLLDWYHRKYGDALASVRHIVAQLKERDPAGIGLYTGDVHSALKDLETWGYITADVGIGRRASRYVPVWAHGRSVHKTPNTTENEISVRENQNTSVRETPNTTSDSVHKTPNQDPSTVTRLQDGVTVIDGYDCAPPSAPLPDGLEATGAGGAQGGFEELWKTYFPKRGQGDKKKARSAYDALNPDADLHASLLDAASSWFEAWQAQGKPDAPRKHLDTWLTGEHYDCEPPTAYKKKEKPTTSKKEAVASNDNEPAEEDDIPEWAKGRPASWPIGVHRGEFVGGDVTKEGGDTEVSMTFKREDGAVFTHRFYSECFSQTFQSEGQAVIQSIMNALELSGVDDTDYFLFKPLIAVADGKTIAYARLESA